MDKSIWNFDSKERFLYNWLFFQTDKVLQIFGVKSRALSHPWHFSVLSVLNYY